MRRPGRAWVPVKVVGVALSCCGLGGRASCGGGRKVQDHGGGDELAERVGDHLVRHQDKEYAHVITCQS